MGGIEIRHGYLRKALFICVFLSAAVIIGFLAKARPAAILAAAARIDPIFLLLGLLSVLASWVVEGVRMYLIAAALGKRISVARLIRINIATAFSGNVVPMASMAAPPTQIFLLHREGVPVGKATAIVAVRTAASTLFYTTVAPVLFLGFGRTFVRGLTTNLALATVIQLVFIVSSIVALTTLGILIRPELGARLANAAFSTRVVKKLLGSRSEQVMDRVARETKAFHESMNMLFSNTRDAALIAFLTVIYWGLYFSVGPLLLLGVGFPLTLRGTAKLMVFLFLTYFLLSYLPIPTGSGVSELGFGSILIFFGIPDPIRTVILVVWSFLCVQVYTLLGGVFFLGALRRREPIAGKTDSTAAPPVPPKP